MAAIFLPNTTDKFQLVTSAAATLSVLVSYSDLDKSGTPILEDVGRQGTAITTATTTDICAAPASTKRRNIRGVWIANNDSTLSCTVTPRYNANATTYDAFGSWSLAPGQVLEYSEATGWFKIADEDDRLNQLHNASTADQAIGASVTEYLVGSSISIPASSLLRAGTILRWTVILSKTAAGVATRTITTRFGTAGTTADTARNTFTGDTETAIADEACEVVTATIRGPITNSCIVQAIWISDDNLTTTGFSNTARKAQIRLSTSAAFDITTAGTIAGLAMATGAAEALTIRQVIAEMLQPR